MTKPSDFILNTDYLPLAQTSTSTLTAYFTQATITGGTVYEKTVDFNVKPTQGAIDRILISRNGGDYTVGNSVNVPIASNGFFTIWVYRPSPSIIRVRLRCASSQNVSLPAQTISVKVASFEPPNVF